MSYHEKVKILPGEAKFVNTYGDLFENSSTDSEIIFKPVPSQSKKDIKRAEEAKKAIKRACRADYYEKINILENGNQADIPLEKLLESLKYSLGASYTVQQQITNNDGPNSKITEPVYKKPEDKEKVKLLSDIICQRLMDTIKMNNKDEYDKIINAITDFTQDENNNSKDEVKTAIFTRFQKHHHTPIWDDSKKLLLSWEKEIEALAAKKGNLTVTISKELYDRLPTYLSNIFKQSLTNNKSRINVIIGNNDANNFGIKFLDTKIAPTPEETNLFEKYKNIVKSIGNLYIRPHNHNISEMVGKLSDASKVINAEKTQAVFSTERHPYRQMALSAISAALIPFGIGIFTSAVLAYRSYKSTGSVNFFKPYTKGGKIVQTTQKSFPEDSNFKVKSPTNKQ
jgi:translation initiation factor 1 (eIF-1/SUI1)